MQRRPSRFRAASFFLVRAPVLPWRSVMAALAPDAPVATRDELLAARRVARQRLAVVVREPQVREALWIASPSLIEQLAAWEAAIDRDEIGALDKIEQSLVRYLERMATRPTPFGLFAGVAVGVAGAETVLRIVGPGARCVRLDSEVIAKVVHEAMTDPACRDRFRYRPNSARIRVGDVIQFPEIAGGDRHAYRISAIEATAAIEVALARATGGATRGEIADAVAALGAERDEALAFVDELIDSGALEGSALPPLTCDDPLAWLIGELPAGRLRDQLGGVRDELARLHGRPLGETVDYGAVLGRLERLALPSAPKNWLQIDARLDARCELGPRDREDLAKACEVLWRLAEPPRPDPELAAFVRAFEERYEGREVPLLEALNDDIGIGYKRDFVQPAPLIAELPIGARREAPSLRHTDRFALLLRKLEEAWRHGLEEIAITDADLAQLRGESVPSQVSIAAFVTVHPGGRLEISGMAGGSAARTLARFCTWDAELTRLVREHLRDEEAAFPDAILAEVVHVPAKARAQNLALRPVLRAHEIAVCAQAGVDPGHTIALDDLSISLAGGRIRLRSRRLDTEIVPRFSTSLVYQVTGGTSPGYFLEALMYQQVITSFVFRWGALGGARALPRVVAGNVILSRRRWHLDEPDLAGFAASDPFARFTAAQELRRRLGLPRGVALVEDDLLLQVDLDSSLSIDALAGRLAHARNATLVEAPGGEGELVLESDRGTFAHELVVPVLFTPAERTVAPLPPAPVGARPEGRKHLPGGDWLYARLFSGVGLRDRHLRELVAPLTRDMLASGAADRWFFIRYGDPEPHLRIRWHGDPGRLVHEVLAQLRERVAPLIESGLVARLELATYERELERYGGAAALALCEDIFHADSDAALGIVEQLADVPEGRPRWGCALLGMARLLDDFDLPLAERLAVMESALQGFVREFAVTPQVDRAIAARYREERGYVERVLGGGELGDAVRAVLDRRSQRVRPLADRLRAASPVPLRDVLWSLLHMWNNRVLHTSAREQELVLAAFLTRHYQSAVARQRSRAVSS